MSGPCHALPEDENPRPDSSSDSRALETALSRACLDLTVPVANRHDLRRFLAEHAVPGADIDAILDGPARLMVYRSLVRNGLSAVVLRMLPRTRARMNTAAHGRFDGDFARFVDAVAPRTHYVRDVPSEFYSWAGPQWRADARLPPYLADLAAHELAQFAVGSAEEKPAGALAEVALDKPLVFSASTHFAVYAWAVHELPEDEESTAPPLHRDVRLLGYRDPKDLVRWLELTPLAGSIVARVMAGDCLGSAVEHSCADRGVTAGIVARDVARLLADLGSRGVLLGAPAG